MAMKFSCSIVLLIICVKLTQAQSNDVCSYFRRGAEELCNQSITSSSQGRPGKRGAAGSPGPKGEQGKDGMPGICNCSLEEIFDELKDIPNFRRKNTFNINDKLSLDYCIVFQSLIKTSKVLCKMLLGYLAATML